MDPKPCSLCGHSPATWNHLTLECSNALLPIWVAYILATLQHTLTASHLIVLDTFWSLSEHPNLRQTVLPFLGAPSSPKQPITPAFVWGSTSQEWEDLHLPLPCVLSICQGGVHSTCPMFALFHYISIAFSGLSSKVSMTSASEPGLGKAWPCLPKEIDWAVKLIHYPRVFWKESKAERGDGMRFQRSFQSLSL